MDTEKFEALLRRSEGPTIDFKQESYVFGGADAAEKNYRRTKFVKDIVAFINTPREESAYIVLGVKKKSDGSVELLGLNSHLDDNVYQQAIDTWVYPFPPFSYHEVLYLGKQFGVLEIPVNHSLGGPFYPTTQSRGEEVLRPSTLYWRRGSKNSEASAEERNRIHAWFLDNPSPIPVMSSSDSWATFISALGLESGNRRYMLFLGLEGNAVDNSTASLSAVPWGMVADFDPDSETTGSLSKVRPSLAQRRAIHVTTKGDAAIVPSERSTDWYFAKGLSGRASSLPGGKLRDWLNTHAGDFRARIERFASASAAPLVAVAIWTDTSQIAYLRRSLELTLEAFGEAANLIIVTDQGDAFSQLEQDLGAIILNIDLRHFFEALTSYSAKISNSTDLILVPGIEGTEKQILLEDLAWLEEDLEVLHLGCGTHPPERTGGQWDFLRGATISWFELGLRVDAERDKTIAVQRLVRDDLLRRQASRVNLYHKPGAGGSTVARRIVWELRREFPSIILRRCEPRDTAERVAWLFKLTDKPVLILREGNIVDDGRADELFKFLRSRNVPFVILQVHRRYELPQEKERIFPLDAQLTLGESFRFVEILSRESPGQRSQLVALSSSANGTKTPFIFGLTAFEENFRGIGSYVASHLADLLPIQKKIILFLSIAHKYGHASIHAQNFAELLEFPPSRSVDLMHALSIPARGLLVENSKNVWRTAHELIATEAIRQILSEGQQDTRNWKARLVDSAIEFAQFCNPNRAVELAELETLVERVFLYRDDSDPLATAGSGAPLFSALMSDIPTKEGRLRLFSRLVELFPRHPHFWAHLGRFYSVEMHRISDAISAIDRAIDLSPSDNVLHHMKGMALRKQVYDELAQDNLRATAIDHARVAASCFAEARRLAPDDEHGYISEVQMLIRIIDKLSAKTGKAAVILVAESADQLLRESFQTIEDLLQDVRHLRRGERPSKHEEDCRANLDLLYGAHELALQRWQNLLDRKNGTGSSAVFAPPIRCQIVWTYLARNGRSWRKMSQKDLHRTVDLLNTNIEEQPNDDKSYRLWIQGARYMVNPPSLDFVLERIAYWKAGTDDLEATYYTFVVSAVQALSGSVLAVERAQRALEEMRNKTRWRRDRTASFEWLGKESGMKSLVQHESLGEWNEKDDFWENQSLLARVEGVIFSLAGPQAGEIEVARGLRAFFVPGNANIFKGRDENTTVTCYLGFSYDGLRAWSVERISRNNE